MKKYPWLTSRRVAAALAVAALASPVWQSAQAAEPAPAGTPEVTAAEAPLQVSPLPGMVVAIDPKTGKVREPSPAELAALRQSFSLHFKKPKQAMQLVEREGGSLSMVVAGEEFSYSLARLGANGKLETTCVHSADEAAQYLLTPAGTVEEK